MAITTALIVGTVVSAVAAIGTGVATYMSASAASKKAANAANLASAQQSIYASQQAAAYRQQATYTKQQSDYAKAIAARNQQVSEIAAEAALKKGKYDASVAAETQRKLLSTQLAQTGASGVDIYGSPLEVMGQSWAEGSRDIGLLLYNSNYDAWKYRESGTTSLLEGKATAARYDAQTSLYNSQASQYDTQAGIYGSQKQTASTSIMPLISGGLSAGTSLLTGYTDYLKATG